jgi:hypothetical protein
MARSAGTRGSHIGIVEVRRSFTDGVSYTAKAEGGRCRRRQQQDPKERTSKQRRRDLQARHASNGQKQFRKESCVLVEPSNERRRKQGGKKKLRATHSSTRFLNHERHQCTPDFVARAWAFLVQPLVPNSRSGTAISHRIVKAF